MDTDLEPFEGETFGDFLRRARMRRGWSQETLAAKLGTKRTYVVQIETGRIKWPAQYVEKMADLLGVRLSAFGRAAGRIVPDHPLKASAIGTSTARATLTVGARNAPATVLGDAALDFIGSLTDRQRAALLRLIENAAKLAHLDDDRDEEETREESPMTN